MPYKINRVIMLYGYPLSGKSTAAAKIRDYLAKKGEPAEIISSAKFRLKGRKHGSSKGFVDEKKESTKRVKDKAYGKLCKRAEICLGSGITPVLDATFHKYYRRKQVYDLTNKWKAETYVVWVTFDNEEAIRDGLRKRMLAKNVVALHTWKQYSTMASQTEKVEDHELAQKLLGVKIIKFDRGKMAIKLYGCVNDSFAEELARAISASY